MTVFFFFFIVIRIYMCLLHYSKQQLQPIQHITLVKCTCNYLYIFPTLYQFIQKRTEQRVGGGLIDRCFITFESFSLETIQTSPLPLMSCAFRIKLGAHGQQTAWYLACHTNSMKLDQPFQGYLEHRGVLICSRYRHYICLNWLTSAAARARTLNQYVKRGHELSQRSFPTLQSHLTCNMIQQLFSSPLLINDMIKSQLFSNVFIDLNWVFTQDVAHGSLLIYPDF